jgi:hypothetical protein
MWMFGKVNKEELEQITNQGWQIDRYPLPSEVDEFVDPPSKNNPKPSSPEPIEDDDDKFVLIYFDEDISKVCDDILIQQLPKAQKDAVELEQKITKELEDLRRFAADEAFSHADPQRGLGLAEEQEVIDSDHWVIEGDKWTKVFYVTPMVVDDDYEKISFVVNFEKNSDFVEGFHVNVW